MDRKWRSVFVSDVHMGTPGCHAARLIKFLKDNESDNLFLVGDVIDGWSLRRRWYWDDAHSDLIDTVLGIARSGTHVVYVSGNHDDFLRGWTPVVPGIGFVDKYLHTSADGYKYLVIHGDQFDKNLCFARFGHALYTECQRLEDWVSNLFTASSPCRFSLSRWVKNHLERLTHYTDSFIHAAENEAAASGCCGVLTGHTHHATIIGSRNRPSYMNDGDWVESCTAIAEDRNGNFQILEG